MAELIATGAPGIGGSTLWTGPAWVPVHHGDAGVCSDPNPALPCCRLYWNVRRHRQGSFMDRLQ